MNWLKPSAQINANWKFGFFFQSFFLRVPPLKFDEIFQNISYSWTATKSLLRVVWLGRKWISRHFIWKRTKLKGFKERYMYKIRTALAVHPACKTHCFQNTITSWLHCQAINGLVSGWQSVTYFIVWMAKSIQYW